MKSAPAHLRLLIHILVVWLFGASLALSAAPQMENLGRGVVALRTSTTQVYVGWRMLGTDPDAITFNLYRSIGGGAATLVNPTPLVATTDYRDTPGSTALSLGVAYQVRPVIDGVEQAASAAFTLAADAAIQPFFSVPLQIPPGGFTPTNEAYIYNANDLSPADLDGDGEYELVVKWEPTNAKDNSQDGYTGNTLLDAYKLDGTRLWRIDLGRNIRSGAHYTQFIVYDFDADGRAELACKTAPGTLDGLGAPVLLPGDSATADYRNSAGRILSGPEYLTVFDGLSGAQLATTPYLPGRGTVAGWGDTYGNRVDRFVAGVAYLDGEHPSLVMCRGYYTQIHIVAWDWRAGALTRRWNFSAANDSIYAGQGNHQLSVADVDDDGRQEIIYGAIAVDDDGTGLYSTRLGHSDALHVSDLQPSRPGQEVFTPHENAATNGNIGSSFRDARTGQLLWTTFGNGDIGRACAMDLDPRYPGAEAWASNGTNLYSAYGNVVATLPSATPTNFGVWWDADPQRELLDGTTISKWLYATSTRSDLLTATTHGAAANNGTKATPALSSDILGDWREEVIWRRSDNTALLVFTTTIQASDRRRTFLADPQYRVALAWQNVGYNQPPHPSFDLSTMPAFWAGSSSGTWGATSALWSRGNTGHSPAPLQGGDLPVLRSDSPLAITLADNLAPSGLIVDSDAAVSVAGSATLVSPGAFNKAGSGALAWNANGTFAADSNIFSGDLLLGSGARLAAPRFTVFTGAGVGGPGALAGALDLRAGSAIHLRVGGPLAVEGSVTLTGAVTVHAAPGETLAAGTYPLFTYTGSLSASPSFTWVGEGYTATFDTQTAGVVRITLVVKLRSAALTWTGAASGTWDATTVNWIEDGVTLPFKDGDSARFDDTSSRRALTLNAVVKPLSVTFDTAGSWTLTGTGALADTATLIKSGSGSLTLGTANTHTGGTRLNAGTLVLTNANGLGAGLVTLAGGTIDIGALTLPTANTLVLAGSARVRGGSSSGAQGIKAVRGEGVLTLEATDIFDLEGGMANYTGRLVFTGTNAFRFFGSNGSSAATFDLGDRSISTRSGSTVYLGALEGGTSAVLTGASGSSTSAVTYVVGEKNRNTMFSGIVTNGNAATALHKYGTGRLQLTGNSTYTGTTGVAEGALIVTGSLGSSPVVVLNNATFGGKTGGSLTLYAGARIALSVSPGGTRGPVVGGALAIAGLVTVVPEDLGGTLAPGTYDLITYGGAPSGSPQWVWEAPAGSPLVATFDSTTAGVVRMTLVDGRSDFERWADALFDVTAPVASKTKTADPDGDGLPNLLEYALGGDPLSADAPAIQPMLGRDASTGALTLAFDRVADASLTYEVEASDTLNGTDWTLVWLSTGEDNTPGRVVVIDSVNAESRPRRFLRLKVN